MKPHVENQIKNAFENWDNQANDVGFDKASVWQTIEANSHVKKFNWLKVAAILLFFIFTGAMAYTFHANIKLREQNQKLISKLEEQSDNIVIHTDTIIQKEIKIQYKTVEVKKDDKQVKEQLNLLTFQNQTLSKENSILKKQITDFTEEKVALKNQLNPPHEKINREVKTETSKPESKPLKITINKEALMAISKDDRYLKSEHPVNGKKLIFSITSKPDIPETTAPIFRSIHQ